MHKKRPKMVANDGQKVVSVRMDEDLYRDTEDLAKESGRSVSSAIGMVMKENSQRIKCIKRIQNVIKNTSHEDLEKVSLPSVKDFYIWISKKSLNEIDNLSKGQQGQISDFLADCINNKLLIDKCTVLYHKEAEREKIIELNIGKIKLYCAKHPFQMIIYDVEI